MSSVPLVVTWLSRCSDVRQSRWHLKDEGREWEEDFCTKILDEIIVVLWLELRKLIDRGSKRSPVLRTPPPPRIHLFTCFRIVLSPTTLEFFSYKGVSISQRTRVLSPSSCLQLIERNFLDNSPPSSKDSFPKVLQDGRFVPSELVNYPGEGKGLRPRVMDPKSTGRVHYVLTVIQGPT